MIRQGGTKLIPDSDPDPASSPTDNSEVVCRRPRAEWFGVALLSLLGSAPLIAIPQLPPHEGQGGIVFCCVLSGFFLSFAIWLTLLQIRGFIVADADSLRWREARDERCVNWTEVRDYYIGGDGYPVIETTAGNLKLDGWTDVGTLMEFVVRHATKAVASSWERASERGEIEWPLIYHYNTRSNLWMPCILCFVGLVLGLAGLLTTSWPKLYETIEIMWRWLGPIPTMVQLIFAIVLLLGFVCMFFWITYALWREAHSRGHETYTATPTGLTFHNGTLARTIHWVDITRYYRAPESALAVSRFVVEAGDTRFEWSGPLHGKRSLTWLVQRLAVNASTNEWRSLDALESSNDAQLNFERTGERLFFYGGQNYRLVIIYAYFLLLLPASVAFATHTANAGPGILGWIAAACCALIAPATHAYLNSVSILVTRDAIIQMTLLKRTALSWTEVDHSLPPEAEKQYFVILQGSNIALRILNLLQEPKEFVDLVNQKIQNTHQNN